MSETIIPAIHTISAPNWKDYELIDTGEGSKLERFGNYTFLRPEAQAVWPAALPRSSWEKADAIFQTTGEENGGHWKFNKIIPDNWLMQYMNIRFKVQAGGSRHLGVFPEQAAHWDWMKGHIQNAKRQIKVLNLFGYTGLATLTAASYGALVTHVDASKKAVSWARENQTLSNLDQKPIRWMVDDALKFVERENRRGTFYDGIMLDPPKFGRGPKGEVWEFFKLLPSLVQACKSALSEKPSFFIMTAYAVKSSALTLHGTVKDLIDRFGGNIEVGELVTVEKSAGRLISNAIYARWSS
ncbi:MAG: SAM-dependent methyltransferase [Anaerolinea sp.]|nr:SAM-dependent methyltransferase [Anaerolinea sp.]